MSATVIIDAEGRLTGVVLGRDDTLHIVADDKGEAVLFYDEMRDQSIRGYGRSGLASYGPNFVFKNSIMYCRETTPVQPPAKEPTA